MGLIHLAQGEYGEASELFENASQVDPAWSQPKCNMAISLIEQQRMDEAMEIYAAI